MTMPRGKVHCWNVPARGDLPAFTVVQEPGAQPYVVGEHGPRILAIEESLRWMKFIVDLRRSTR